jgi:hypothetical protein
MNMKHLAIFSLIVSISTQANNLDMEQLEANAKNTPEYKKLENLEKRFVLYAKDMISARAKCGDRDVLSAYFNRDCQRMRKWHASAHELVIKKFEAEEAWELTPEYQAWKNAQANQK